MNPVLRRLTPADEPGAAVTLADAFVADPLFVRLFGSSDDSEGERHVRVFLEAVIAMNRWGGGLRLGMGATDHGGLPADALLAAALVARPVIGSGVARSRLSMLRFLPAALALPRSTVGTINRYGVAVRRAAPRAPHHYLSMLGVRPSHQGQGLASALLAAVVDVAEADPASTGVALDTENEDNVALYERRGFTVTSRSVVEGLPVWCMVRPTRRRKAD